MALIDAVSMFSLQKFNLPCVIDDYMTKTAYSFLQNVLMTESLYVTVHLLPFDVYIHNALNNSSRTCVDFSMQHLTIRSPAFICTSVALSCALRHYPCTDSVTESDRVSSRPLRPGVLSGATHLHARTRQRHVPHRRLLLSQDAGRVSTLHHLPRRLRRHQLLHDGPEQRCHLLLHLHWDRHSSRQLRCLFR